MLFKTTVERNIFILAAFAVTLYLLVSLYFIDHTYWGTEINGAEVSLKAHAEVEDILRSYVKEYKLQLIERYGAVEEITGQEVGMQYNGKNSIAKIYQLQDPMKWPVALFKGQKHYAEDLFVYDKEILERKIDKLNCLNKEATEPRNVSFKYSNGSYEAVEEVYGNKINREKMQETLKRSILKGVRKLDLDESQCYENPKYTLKSDKVINTKSLLDRYVSAKITYKFGSQNELVDGTIINRWLGVDDNLEVVIDIKAVYKYVQGLSKKYDTVGIARRFKTSTNKMVEVKGGFYGWKLHCAAETKALIENIMLGKAIEKEPIYARKAISRGQDDIGSTYVEINITKQYLWFYKDGKLVTRGAVVTGNPNKGYSTKVGAYMLNYKMEKPALRGPGYEVEVNYWMPFNGNIGIHDASWRYSFGGDIYKKNGSHGCVNTTLYLAKKIYFNIEDGTPVICYEE